jgi:hypothetical protein
MKRFLLALALAVLSQDVHAQICPATNGKACDWTIDKTNPASQGVTVLRNGATVNVKIMGTTPFDVCELKKDRSEITPDKDAFAAFLEAISKFGGALTFGSAGAAARKPDRAMLAAAHSPGAKQFQDLFDRATAEATALKKDLDNFKKNLDSFQNAANDFRKQPDHGRTGSTPEDYEKAFTANRATITGKIARLQAGRPVSDLFKRYISDLEKLRGGNEFSTLSQEEKNEVDQSLRYVYLWQTGLQVLLTQADDAIKAAVDYGKKLADLENKFDKSLPAFSDADAKDKLSVSCKDGVSGKVTMDTVYAAVEFHGRPPLTFSLGILASTLDSVQIGKKDVSDGQGKSKTLFAETDRKDFQAIPFSFLNWRIPGLDDFRIHKWPGGINLTTGFGINPNTGSKEPEFFTGGALGVGSVLFYLGVHWGRVQSLGGNFNLGDVVPSGVTVPVNETYQRGFGFGISYQLPIP